MLPFALAGDAASDVLLGAELRELQRAWAAGERRVFMTKMLIAAQEPPVL